MTIQKSTYWGDKKVKLKILLAGILFSFSINASFSQHQKPKIFFDHFGPLQGFNSTQALCIGKTSDGFVWIGTDFGLVRYDGHQFKLYLHEEGNNQTITGNYVRNLKVDKYDRIWMDAGEKLCVYDWKKKEMYTPDMPSKSGKRKQFQFFYEGDNDRIWIATNDGVFYNEGSELALNEFIIKKLKNKNFQDIAVDKKQGIWLISDEGLVSYNRSSGLVSIYKSDVQINDIPSYYLSMFIDDKFIWIGSWVKGLTRFDLTTREQKTFTWQDATKFQNGVLDIQTSGIKGDEDHLWLATTSGILTFNKKTEAFTNYFSENNYDHYKINGSGFSFLPTEKEGFWIGTYKGLHRYDPKKQLVQQKKLYVNEVYQNYLIQGFCFQKGRKDSIVFLRYYYGDIIKYDLVNDRVIPLPEKLKKYCEGKREIYHIFLDKYERLWLTSRADGMVIYNTQTDQLTIPENVNDFKEDKVIFDIIQNSNGQIYLAGINKIFQYDEISNSVKEMDELSALMKKENIVKYINNVSLDSEDNLWFVGKDHHLNEDLIVMYDSKQHVLKKINSNDKNINGMLKHVETMKFNTNKKLYISSESGLIEYDARTKLFKDLKIYRARDIEIGSGSDVWASNDLGISKINVKSKIVTNFTYFNSPIGQMPRPLIIKSPNEDRLWIAQKGMFNIIGLKDLRLGDKDTIQLTEMEIKNTDFSKGKVHDLLNLKYNQNEINLKFSIFNFTNSVENIYHYKLNGDVWKNMKGNELSFQELAYGEYELEVRAYNSFGISSANNYKMKFVINPPFWRSSWFNLLMLLLIGLSIYAVFRYREKQRLNLEKLRFNIARDLHDDLGSNLSQIKLISEIESMKNQQSKFTDVAHKLDDVMQNMKEIVWSINPKYDQLEDVISKVQEFAIQILEPKGINLKFNIDEIPKSIKLSPENKRNYYLIFKEAINNTVKYSQAKNVNFSIKYNGNSLISSLTDDGKGYDERLISNGNGLSNMKSRASAMKAKLNISTSEEGTRIELVLKQ